MTTTSIADNSPADHNQDSIRARKRAAYISVAIGCLLFCTKMGGYLITGSAAILSDALESVVHVLATGFAAYSVIFSARPADRSHPYGHGKIEFFSAGLEGGLIIVAAVAICATAIPKLVHPPALPNLGWGTLLITIAGVTNLFLGWYLIHVGNKESSLTLVADGKHVLTDSYTSLGVVAGLLLVLGTGWKVFDPIVALAVAVNIIVTGYKLIRESISGLMHEADADLIAKITNVLNDNRRDTWIDVHRLRCWKAGEALHVDCHLTLPFYMDIASAHEIEEHIQQALSAELDMPLQLIAHHDPCVPKCCHTCVLADCQYRTEPLDARPLFSPTQVVQTAHYAPI